MKIKVNGKDENIEIGTGGCLVSGLGCAFIFWLPIIVLVILVWLIKLVLK